LGKSARSVIELIQNKTKVELSVQTIQKKVQEGEIGTLPLRRGPQGNIPELHYRNLCLAFQNYIRINQINGTVQECGPKKVGPRIYKVIYGNNGEASWRQLLKRVLVDTAVDLKKARSKNAEDRRIRWMNHKNITMWFENWEHDLMELGFATRHPDTGKIDILDKQLALILNFDEMCLNLDGASTTSGGRPEASIYNPRFPMVGKATCKCSLTSTLITGSTAAGEALLPHIQYVTKAKSNETMRLDLDVLEHAQQVLGTFGGDEECEWPVSFGQNEKGGMDEVEFSKYLLNSIVPLFPHA
jgi:hypothetical protein